MNVQLNINITMPMPFIESSHMIPSPPPQNNFELWKIINLNLLLVHFVLLCDMMRSLLPPHKNEPVLIQSAVLHAYLL